MKLLKHIRRWNMWRKGCRNGKIHKLLVLLGITKSPTMQYVFLPEECNIMKAINKYVRSDEDGAI